MSKSLTAIWQRLKSRCTYLNARVKAPGLMMRDLEAILDDDDILVPSLTFQFDFQDAEKDLQTDN